jgi:hypothetical protein
MISMAKHKGNRAAAEEEALAYYRGTEQDMFNIVDAADLHRLNTNTPLLDGASILDAQSCWTQAALEAIATPEKLPQLPSLYHQARPPPPVLPERNLTPERQVRTISISLSSNDNREARNVATTYVTAKNKTVVCATNKMKCRPAPSGASPS